MLSIFIEYNKKFDVWNVVMRDGDYWKCSKTNLEIFGIFLKEYKYFNEMIIRDKDCNVTSLEIYNLREHESPRNLQYGCRIISRVYILYSTFEFIFLLYDNVKLSPTNK